ncbi:protease modulator HflC [Candidatus Blochmanniella camponoti]|uniref:Protein HflC n=1 Tax=Candidatus Blochmanniella camponoti TaxID=108080 RepID=A0ABY4STY9_9ENTR|nr:protease modulator HflC [Candidatus Blochmannia herculeanus]URJ24523.1 protease modulator HflC [Candidatus Blochmannia herculeanus]URJ26870.1 protease modulator HflC [Candidatus Blochmannia herculeanus]
MIRNFFSFVICVIIVLFFSLFTIEEGHKGIILRFGKVLRDADNNSLIYNPGLHIKIPFIETIKILDSRIQTMDNQADRFVTMEKKDLIIDSYVKWRISDLSRYYLATGGGDICQAEVLIKRKFSDRLRSELGRLNVQGIVTDSRNKLMTDVRASLNHGTSGEEVPEFHFNNNIKQFNFHAKNYDSSMQEQYRVSDLVNPNSMAALGIEIVDVRIKQINLPTEVSDAIYQRMRAERDAVARRHRSQGREEAEKLRATADYEVTRTLAEAKRQSLIIRGEADAETAKLYATTFNEDPSFYALVRTLRAYENSFKKNNNDLMVLSAETDFFRFMKSPKSTTGINN